MSANTYSEIATRRHPQIKAKEAIWNLIADSYAGGEAYVRKGHLFRFPKENRIEYEARVKRAVFFNHVQPLSDMLAGFLFKKGVKRKLPTGLEFLESSATKRKGLNSFMQTVSIHSLMYTCGVLVDSPKFNTDNIRTKADEALLNLQPYCVLYTPDKIRDFYVEEDGQLLWVLLDNTEICQDDPLQPARKKVVYRLWVRDKIQDFEIKQSKTSASSEVTLIAESVNPLGEVPFIFVNWRDMDDDFIAETPFEDIAMLDRAIFNFLSYFDQMVAGGTFKVLFFPITSPEDLPKSVEEEGLGSLSVVPYPAMGGAKPFFDGQGLQDVAPFVAGMEMYFEQIMQKLGLDRDKKQAAPQSGYAKELDFSRCEALLQLGAEQQENTERRIVELAAKWLGIQNPNPEIEYSSDFASEDIDAELTRLYQLLTLPFKTMRKLAYRQIAARALPGIPAEDQKAIDTEIEAYDKKPEPTSNLVKAEAAVRQQNQTGQTAEGQ